MKGQTMKITVCVSAVFIVGIIGSPSGLASTSEAKTQPIPAHSNDESTAETARDPGHAYARYLNQMDRLEKNMDRQDADIARYERILATWERQQAQYQKYLDGLAHK